MSQYRADFDSLPWRSPMGGVRCKVSRHNGRQLRLVEYTTAMDEHWCDKGHAGCVLEGRLEIRFAEETVVFGPGDGIFIPTGSDHRHMARVLTDVVRVVFVEDA